MQEPTRPEVNFSLLQPDTRTPPTNSTNHTPYSWSDNLQNQSELLTSRHALIITCYAAIVVVSLFGNSLVCSIVARNAGLRGSPTYIFVTNLALSDLMMTILNIPFNVARLLLRNWPFGRVMCSFVPLMQVTSVYVSTFTMTCIAVDRYRVVDKPLRPRIRSGQAIKITFCIWILGILLSLPHAIFNQVRPIFTFRTLSRCRTVYPKDASLWITLVTVITQYILPLSVTGVLYCLITARVWSRNTLGAVTEAQVISQAKAKRKTIKMLVLVVIFFALCWLPLNVFNVLREFKQQELFYKPSTTIYFVCHWLAMSSVCYNPFIYCWLNEHFRSGAINSIICIKDLGRKASAWFRSTANLLLIGVCCETSMNPGMCKFSNRNSSTKRFKSALVENELSFMVQNTKVPMIYYSTKLPENPRSFKRLDNVHTPCNSAPNLTGNGKNTEKAKEKSSEIISFNLIATEALSLKKCSSWYK